MEDFNFDIMKFNTEELNPWKYRVVIQIFKDIGTLDIFEVQNSKFLAYIKKAEVFYERNKNAFHNFEHGLTGNFHSIYTVN